MTAAGLDARGLPAGYAYRPEWETTPRELRAAMSDAGRAPVVLDVRSAAERSLARIEGSLHIPMGEVDSRLADIEVFSAECDREIVIYCHHGVRSLKVVAFLRDRGVPARSMAGGLDLWSLDIDPTVPRYEHGPTGWRAASPTSA